MKKVIVAMLVLMSAKSFGSSGLCGTVDETAKLSDQAVSLGDCTEADGTFQVNLPAGMGYHLYTHNLDKGDFCKVSAEKRGSTEVVTIEISLEPDSEENCQLFMFDPKDETNHGDLSITAGIGS